jgi:hypothetical protein
MEYRFAEYGVEYEAEEIASLCRSLSLWFAAFVRVFH